MIPPTATTHNSRRWMLNIMEKPMAEIAAAIAICSTDHVEPYSIH